MAPLYGRLRGNRGGATRTDFEEIAATLETWTGQVSVRLFKDGTYVVEVGEKHGTGRTVFGGNVDDEALDVPGWVNG